MTQYTLDMKLPVAYAAQQFICSGSNQLAYDWITRWPDWPGNALYLQGAKGSGKTHLAHIWCEQTNGHFITPNSTSLPAMAVIIDEIEQWENEHAFFHLYNHCKAERVPLLITSSLPPDQLHFTLPDVRSRLKSLPIATIAPPDDALLEAVLGKQLADRQLKISPDVFAYILPRLPRSFEGLNALVNQIDTESLAAGRTLTIPFVRNFL